MNKIKDNQESEINLSSGILGRWSLVNKNYELLKTADSMAKIQKWANLKMFLKQKLALFGFVLFILITLMALIMPPFLNDPHHVDPSKAHLNLFESGHVLGTDYLGRDIWSRLWNGLRFSLGMAAMAVLVDLILGYVFGALMGFFPIIDKIGQFIIKILINLPTILILILLSIVLTPSFWTIVLGITITGWIGMANQVRGYVIKTKNQDWVLSSRTLGTSKSKVLFKKMTPHLIPIIIAQLIFTIPTALIGDLSLSVLGLSIPNTATLGSLLEAGRKFILIYPREAIVPILVITTILSSVQFIGFGMQKVVGRSA